MHRPDRALAVRIAGQQAGDPGRDDHPGLLRIQRAGRHLCRAPAGPDADDDAGQRVERPAGPDAAAHLPDPAAHLAVLRLVPAGRALHLLDRDHDLLDRAAVPDRRLGWSLPAVRLDAGLRARSQAALPHPARDAASRERGWHRTATHTSEPDRPSGRDHQAGPFQGTYQPARETSMSEYQEFTGKTVEEALRGARESFGVASLDELDFEILTPGSRGVLGMGAEPARIIAAPRSALGGAAPRREAAASTPLPPVERPPREESGGR